MFCSISLILFALTEISHAEADIRGLVEESNFILWSISWNNVPCIVSVISFVPGYGIFGWPFKWNVTHFPQDKMGDTFADDIFKRIFFN